VLKSWGYVASPSRFGRYPVLQPSMAMTTYPDIRGVPDSIPRPPYVPSNFFTEGWGEHLPGSDHKFSEELGTDGVKGVRKAGKVVAEILKKVGKMIKVGLPVSCALA
jgi:methionyl aminopeptidase